MPIQKSTKRVRTTGPAAIRASLRRKSRLSPPSFFLEEFLRRVAERWSSIAVPALNSTNTTTTKVPDRNGPSGISNENPSHSQLPIRTIISVFVGRDAVRKCLRALDMRLRKGIESVFRGEEDWCTYETPPTPVSETSRYGNHLVRSNFDAYRDIFLYVASTPPNLGGDTCIRNTPSP
jgi:hypothetical protein